jgi:hypothetical protein
VERRGGGSNTRRLAEQRQQLDVAVVPRHCSAAEGVCRGAGRISIKQQREMQLMAERTRATLPPGVDGMTSEAADAWLRARWTEFATRPCLETPDAV